MSIFFRATMLPTIPSFSKHVKLMLSMLQCSRLYQRLHCTSFNVTSKGFAKRCLPDLLWTQSDGCRRRRLHFSPQIFWVTETNSPIFWICENTTLFADRSKHEENAATMTNIITHCGHSRHSVCVFLNPIVFEYLHHYYY